MFSIFLFVASIVFTVFGFASETYIVTSALAGGLLCFIGFGLLFLFMLSLKSIKVTSTQIILSSGLKEDEIIERKKIVSFYETHLKRRTRGGYRDYNELTLYTEKNRILISSEVYIEYKQLKQILTKDLPIAIDKSIIEKDSDLYLAITIIVISLIISILCIYYLITNWLESESEEWYNRLSYLAIIGCISSIILGIKSWKKYKRLLDEIKI